MSTNNTTVSLVLGSGGARGYTHIGVIKELITQGYEITSISGASMGALVGGLYAAGKLDVYTDWILGLDLMDVAKLLDLSFSRSGMINGEKVFAVITEMIGDIQIEELPIPYTAVATNLIKQKEVWFQRGSLIDAIRASISIPTIFTPKKIGDDYFIDGGLLDPLPIAPLTADNSDLTIAVDLSAPAVENKPKKPTKNKVKQKANKIAELFWEAERKASARLGGETGKPSIEMGMLDIMGQSIDIMQNAIRECRMAGNQTDIIIPIPNNICGFYEFNRAEEMIEYGQNAAREYLSALDN